MTTINNENNNRYSEMSVKIDKYDFNKEVIINNMCVSMPGSIITPYKEYEKIWSKFDYQTLKNVCEKTKINNDEFHIVIESYEQFEQILKDLKLYDAYIKEKEIMDKKREVLKREDLINIKFKPYQSWETGCSFLILDEQVEKNTFDKLVKSGLHYHKLDEDNEERFNGWCIDDKEMNILKMAENGIRII